MATYDLGIRTLTVGDMGGWTGRISYTDVTLRLFMETTVPLPEMHGSFNFIMPARTTDGYWDPVTLAEAAANNPASISFTPDPANMIMHVQVGGTRVATFTKPLMGGGTCD